MVLARVGSLLSDAVGAAAATARVAVRVGVGPPVRPDRLLGMAAAVRHWGMSPGAICAANAARDPGRVAVIDDRESVTWAELDRRSTAVAGALADRGVVAGDAVAILARNSAGFVVAQAAISKLGADILYANTGFAAPQLGDVLRREGAVAVIADDEFDALLDQAARDLPRLVAWVEDGGEPTGSIASICAAAIDPPELPAPGRDSRHVILTSGTTGVPRGASRSVPAPLAAVVAGVALLDAIPYRPRRALLLAAPAFHAWGLGNLVVASLLSSTIVMRRRFDATAALELVAQHAVDTIVAVPVMCDRLLEVESASATPSLRVVAVSGSALAPTLPVRFMDRFGEVLYNLYGSTEVAFVSVAGPRDLREAPTSAGRVLRGVRVIVVDDDDQPVAPGEVGRIFAGSGLSFDGYTGGEDKARIGTLASIGDLGRFGSDGRLYVEGRDDDMVISGGENVYPGEVEDLLHHHPAVADVAVVGVPDDRFGQALIAHVVRRGGADASAEDLRIYVRTHLAVFKVPRDVVFHDRLPRNETGKVIKRELGDG